MNSFESGLVLVGLSVELTFNTGVYAALGAERNTQVTDYGIQSELISVNVQELNNSSYYPIEHGYVEGTEVIFGINGTAFATYQLCIDANVGGTNTCWTGQAIKEYYGIPTGLIEEQNTDNVAYISLKIY